MENCGSTGTENEFYSLSLTRQYYLNLIVLTFQKHDSVFK